MLIILPISPERIISFINPYLDPLGSGFQTIQSYYAIGPGGILGKGFGSSYQKHFYLPEPQTDFIFSIYAEEFGFVGCIILLLLYALLIKALLKKAIEEIKSEYKINIVLDNGENVSKGKGLTLKHYKELKTLGIAGISMGNHTFSKSEIKDYIDEATISRPANLNALYGKGYIYIKYKMFDFFLYAY